MRDPFNNNGFDPIASKPWNSHNILDRYSDGYMGIRHAGSSLPDRIFEPTPIGYRELNPYEINQLGHRRMIDDLTGAWNPFEPAWNPFK